MEGNKKATGPRQTIHTNRAQTTRNAIPQNNNNHSSGGGDDEGCISFFVGIILLILGFLMFSMF